jgi:hypothetical protein
MIDPDVPEAAGRPQARRFVALLVIGAATAQSLGATLRMPTQLEANDISRWCTVWSLLEKGTYIIDDCPWQNRTQDKVFKVSPFEKSNPDAPKHFYSSKPPLLPTMIAGMLYPFRKLTGVPLDKNVLQVRVPRDTRKEDPNDPSKAIIIKDDVPDPLKWPVYVFYLKPVIVALNILPYLIFLILFARLLDRHVRGDWAWFAGLVAAAWATPLTIFNTTLNNHTISAFSAFFAMYALIRIWEPSGPSHMPEEEEAAPARTPYGAYLAAGFFGAFTACNELPAAAFGILLFLAALARSPKATLLAFIPAALVPIAAFVATEYLATGGLVPIYAEFGTESYEGYEGSFWATPLEMDWFNKHPEPKETYLFHMLLGHHGMFSLTPIFLLALPTMLRGMLGIERRLFLVSWMTFLLTVALVVFYGFFTKTTHNYGGSTQGLRWLFWVFPLWLILVPPGFEPGQKHRGMRWLGLILLAMSILTVGYGMRTPWSHPWILDTLEHFNLYTLTR